MISVTELVLVVKGVCGILATRKKKTPKNQAQQTNKWKNNAAEEWKKPKPSRIYESIAIEAKASWKPDRYKVTSFFWVTKLGYPNICMLIEVSEEKYCLWACFGSLGHLCVAVLALCLPLAHIQGMLVRLGAGRCMEMMLVQKQHSCI